MPLENIKENKSTNSFHSGLLIFVMTALLGFVGWSIAGFWGLVTAMGLAFVGVFFGQRMSPRIVLRMYRARPILPNQSPELTQMFYLLCRRAELDPMPGLFYIPTKLPNAFAVGHDETAAVAVTDGLLRIMNPREIEGILAHEVAHLQHRDTHVMGLADTVARITSTMSRIGLLMMFFSFASIFQSDVDALWFLLRGLVLFFAPTIMVLLQLALSRKREFNADMGAVELTGDAYGLASALDKLERLSKPSRFWNRVLTPGQRQHQPAILRTHPPTEERIKALLSVAKRPETEPPDIVPPRLAPPVRVSNPRRMEIGFCDRVRKKPRYRIMSGVIR